MENRIWIGDLVMGCILQVGWIVQMEFCPRFSSGFLFCFVSFCFFYSPPPLRSFETMQAGSVLRPFLFSGFSVGM